MMPLPIRFLLLAAPVAKPATNTVCSTCPMRVNEKGPSVTVRGQECRTCCTSCSADLEKNPGKCLEKDGTPEKAEKR